MKILSLGGSQWQIPLIETINRLGHESFVVDINDRCPARSLASHFIQADTSDRMAVLEIAKEQGIGMVIAEQTDRFVPVAAYVNHALGLPGLHPDVALRFTDKLEMRRCLTGVVAMPLFREVDNENSGLAFAREVGFPVVIKPKSSQSSYGVSKVDDEDAFRRGFNESLAFSKDGRILVEQFIDGPEITVEGFSIEGHFHLLAVSEKEHYAFNPCVAKRLSYPPRFSALRAKNIAETAAKVVETLGLDTGISHAEYRMLGDTPYLVEVAARGGGTKIAAKIVPHICQFDIYEKLIRSLSGEHIELPVPAGKAAVLFFLDFEPGTVRAVHGMEQLHGEHAAAEIILNFGPGDTIGRPGDDTQRLGYAIVLGEDRDDVDARCRRIQDTLEIEYA